MATSGRTSEGTPLIEHGSYNYALSLYGWDSFPIFDGSNYSALNPSPSGTNILQSPIYATLTGHVGVSSGIYDLNGTTGEYGLIRDATIEATWAYDLRVSVQKVFASTLNVRNDGLSLRSPKHRAALNTGTFRNIQGEVTKTLYRTIRNGNANQRICERAGELLYYI